MGLDFQKWLLSQNWAPVKYPKLDIDATSKNLSIRYF